MPRTAQDERYDRALELLQSGRPRAAEALLGDNLLVSPRAAQSLYLLGVALLAQGRWASGRQLVDRAYQVKPWLRDLSPVQYDLAELAREALTVCPDWSWPRYELERNAFFAVSLSLPTVVEQRLAHDDVFFVEVGANDGVTSDPVYEFVRRHDWSGLVVEPVPDAFAALQENYAWSARVRCVQAAVTDTEGTVTMYRGRNSRLTSLRPERNALRSTGHGSEAITVPAITGTTLLQTYAAPRVDLIQIDTEGYDFAVLNCFDLERLRPLAINMEFYCLPLSERLAAFRLLRDLGYAYRFGGMDLLAVDQTKLGADLLVDDLTHGDHLPSPPRSTSEEAMEHAAA